MELTNEQKIFRNQALRDAAQLCWDEVRNEISARDALLLVENNHAGALTRARQAQTAEKLARAIEELGGLRSAPISEDASDIMEDCG
jgi:hypothetical protein